MFCELVYRCKKSHSTRKTVLRSSITKVDISEALSFVLGLDKI
jgi:hypothetical protein